MPDAPLAQLVEQRTLNPQVLGSNPRGRTFVVCSPLTKEAVRSVLSLSETAPTISDKGLHRVVGTPASAKNFIAQVVLVVLVVCTSWPFC